MILQIIMRLFLSCITITEGVLDDSNVDAENVDEVIMVGGSTGTPWLRAKIASMFNRVRLLTMVHSGANDLLLQELCTSIHPDRAVAEGAAIQGAILAGMDKTVLQV